MASTIQRCPFDPLFTPASAQECTAADDSGCTCEHNRACLALERNLDRARVLVGAVRDFGLVLDL